MAELEARDKLIEAMALDRCPKDDGMGCEKACPRCREWLDVTLAAIAEQGYAVVPREGLTVSLQLLDGPAKLGTLTMGPAIPLGFTPLCEPVVIRIDDLIRAADLARPDPAREDKP